MGQGQQTGGGLLRAFLAFEIPDSIRQGIVEIQRRWRDSLPAALWVRPWSQHLTVKFLGEAPLDRLQALTADLGPRVEGLGPVTVTLAGTGCFPSPRRARVLWIGGDADGAEPVVTAVKDVCADHGFEPERKPWALHLTQARLRTPWPKPALERFLADGAGLRFDPFRCSEVVLYESRLRPTGAVYTAVERVPLK